MSQQNEGKVGRKQAYSLGGIRILSVEEFPFMAGLMASMLREFGVGKVLSTCSVEEAKKLISLHNEDSDKENHIDILTLDLMWPLKNGLDILEWIRRQEKDEVRFLPALFCTAYASQDIVCTGRDYGANEVMVKPVSAEKLAQRLLHIIDRPRPFIKSPAFFGPDRRRQDSQYNGQERRIRGANDLKVVHEKE